MEHTAQRAMTRFPPGPKRGLPGTTFLRFRKNPLAYFERMAREFGDISYVRLGGENIFLLNHPDLIRDVLVAHHENFTKGRAFARTRKLLGEGLLFSEGDFHLRQRRMIKPAFHHQRIAAFAEAMTRHAERLRSRWHDGGTLDVSNEMLRLTLAIVGEALFGADLESGASELVTALNETMKSLSIKLPFAGVLEKLPLPAVRRVKACREKLDEIVYRLINERRQCAEKHSDLLSMLLLAQDEESSNVRMTDEQVRDEVMTILLAGQLTTANSLSWTWYLLSKHLEVETRLHEELDYVLCGRLPTHVNIQALPYTEKVIRESLRLYSPGWMMGRRALNNYEVGGYVAPAGSVLVVSQYVMHRDPRYFPEPLRFDPERWTPEFKAKLPKYAYFPFGGGPRGCIGEGFAWMEMTLIVATVAQQWKLRLIPEHPVVPQPLVTLQPKHGKHGLSMIALPR
jgi:cytochrome P450